MEARTLDSEEAIATFAALSLSAGVLPGIDQFYNNIPLGQDNIMKK